MRQILIFVVLGIVAVFAIWFGQSSFFEGVFDNRPGRIYFGLALIGVATGIVAYFKKN